MRIFNNLSSKMWITCSILFTVVLLFLIFVLSYKVESTVHAKVITEKSTSYLIVNSEIAHKISRGDSINLKIGGKYYHGIISSLHIDIKGIYKIKLSNFDAPLWINDSMEAIIVIGKRSVASFLFK